MDALINGVSLANDIGINVTDFAVSGPSPQVVTTSIPGRDGVLDYSKALTGFVMQNNRTLTVSAYVKETYAEYLERHSKILNSIGTDIVKIVNDADSGFYWQGRPSVEYNNIDAVHSEITITCDVHPYKRKIHETVVSRDLTGAEAQIICKNLAEPVVPTFETSASMKIIFGKKSFNIQSGQHILDLVFGPGDNVLKVTGTGNIKIKYREGSL